MKTESLIRRVMTPSEIAGRVSKLAPKFLAGITPQDIEIILGSAVPRRFRARSLIANEGQPADKLFLVLEGLARTFTLTRKGDKFIILWVAPGEMCGGRAFLSMPLKYLVSTEIVKDSLVLMWDRSAILPLAKKYPRLMENGLLIASDYLETYLDLHIVGSADSAAQRVSRVLEGLAKAMGQPVDNGIELQISNEELANEANVTIFTVSRLLSEWQRRDLVVKSRGRVVLLARQELVQSAS